MKINIGLEEKARHELASILSHILADTYSLYLKTQYFHWNVEGPHFHMLHGMFEEQYEELAEAVDEIAERIRALGQHAPGTFEQFMKLAKLKQDVVVPNETGMLQQLVDDHEAITRELRRSFEKAADLKDDVTVGLLTDRMQAHEKTAWMLRSSLAGR